MKALYKKIGRLLAGAALLCAALALPAAALTPSAALDDAPERTVRVSCGINNALYLDASGEPQGYCSTYLAELAEINHWQLEYVNGSWTESVQNLLAGKIDLLFPTQMTPERTETMAFSTAIGGYQPIGLFARADSTLCYDDYAGFDGARVALSAGTSNEAAMQAYAAENDFSYTPVYLNSTADKMAALADGTVDLIVFSTLNDVPSGKVVAMLDYLPFYYCTRIDDADLQAELGYGMNQMLIRHPDTVESVFYSFLNGSVSFAYTKAEQAAIAQKGYITVGLYRETPPLFDVLEDGEYTGIYLDLLTRIQELSGLDIRLKVLERSEYAFDYLESGEIDYILGSSDQPLQNAEPGKYTTTEGVMDYYTVGITRTDRGLDAAQPLTFALTAARRYWEPDLKKICPAATFDYYPTSKDCLNAVEQGRADVTLLNSWEYNYQSKNQRFQDLMEWENTRTLSQSVFVSLSGRDPLITSVLNKSIEQITNPEKEGIITANLNRAYSSYDFWDRVYLARGPLLLFGALLVLVAATATVYGVMRKKTMRQLQEKNAQLENANQAKDRFLSRMSHELRTPLGAINGYAAVMLENLDSPAPPTPAALRDALNSILRAAGYQLAIISDLLDIQKIESGKLELHPAPVNAERHMQSIVQMIAPEAREKDIEFTYTRITRLSETYLIDAVRLQQVLLNLLHNAVKFTPKGGSVSLSAETIDHTQTDSTLKFVVRDTGIGMSRDFRENYLFHRFAQEYQGNTSPYEGCGTGLAISREIIHLMGGQITCQSEQGKGSTFTVILTVPHLGEKQNAETPPKPKYDLSGLRILLCEDNKMNQDIEQRLLQKMHAEVEIADDGAIGVQRFAESAPGGYDVVLMDIRMPNLDGLGATRAIRALERPDAKTVPILAVSANAFPEDVQKSLDAGMNEHLAKPVDPRVLYAKICRYCRGEPGGNTAQAPAPTPAPEPPRPPRA